METIVRIIIYGFFLGINGLMFLFLHSHFYFTFFVLMIVAPVISILCAALLKRKLSVEITVLGENCAKQHEDVYFQIRVKNPSFFISLDTKLYIEFENTFLNTKGSKVVSVPVRMLKGYTFEIPVTPSFPGIVKVCVAKVKIKDLMGFWYFGKKVFVAAERPVVPYRRGTFQYDASAVEQGMLESEESTKRGNDFSDVQEIREYIPGDRLMSIHWKLSAKRDILMVKDRVSMSDKQLVIVPELWSGSLQMLDMVLTSAYTIIHTFIEDKTTVRLVYWSAKRYEYDDIRIDYAEDVDRAFIQMFYEQPYSNPNEAAEHMAGVYPEVRSYLHVAPGQDDVIIRIRENG